MAIHVVTAPTGALMLNCGANLDGPFSPVIITPTASRPEVLALAKSYGLAEKINILEAEQFLTTYLLERGRFDWDLIRGELLALIAKYNEIIEEVAGEPLLLIGDNTY